MGMNVEQASVSEAVHDVCGKGCVDSGDCAGEPGFECGDQGLCCTDVPTICPCGSSTEPVEHKEQPHQVAPMYVEQASVSEAVHDVCGKGCVDSGDCADEPGFECGDQGFCCTD